MANSNIFGVREYFDITPPAGGVVEESSVEESFDANETIGDDGEVARVCPNPYGQRTARIRGTGNLTPASLVAGTYTAGTAYLSSQIRREYNTKEPSFEMTQKTWIHRFPVTPP